MTPPATTLFVLGVPPDCAVVRLVGGLVSIQPFGSGIASPVAPLVFRNSTLSFSFSLGFDTVAVYVPSQACVGGPPVKAGGPFLMFFSGAPRTQPSSGL